MDFKPQSSSTLVVGTCEVPRTRTSLGERSFIVAGPRLWNIIIMFQRRCPAIILLHLRDSI